MSPQRNSLLKGALRKINCYHFSIIVFILKEPNVSNESNERGNSRFGMKLPKNI